MHEILVSIIETYMMSGERLREWSEAVKYRTNSMEKRGDRRKVEEGLTGTGTDIEKTKKS